jgi:hypothetical protein
VNVATAPSQAAAPCVAFETLVTASGSPSTSVAPLLSSAAVWPTGVSSPVEIACAAATGASFTAVTLMLMYPILMWPLPSPT